MKFRLSKKAMGALLLELIIATAMFFMIQSYVFISSEMPGFSVKPQAEAYIKTVGDTEVCNIDLLNLLRSELNINGKNTKFSEAIVEAYLTDDYAAIDDYISKVSSPNIFQGYLWNFSIESDSNVTFSRESGLPSDRIIECIAFLPIPEPHFSNCGEAQTETVSITDINKPVALTAEEVPLQVTLQNTEVMDDEDVQQFGFLEINPAYVIQTGDLSFEGTEMLISDTIGIDSHSLPLSIGALNRSYDLLMVENCADISSACDQSVDLILSKANTIEQCSVKVSLKISPI